MMGQNGSVMSVFQHASSRVCLCVSTQFDGEEAFNISVKNLLSRLPKQRYLKSICDEIHRLMMQRCVAFRKKPLSFTPVWLPASGPASSGIATF